MESPELRARVVVDAPAEEVRDWFTALEKEPERYQFGTHEGFEFVEGSFGALGARFKTREQFLFLTLELLFEITGIHESQFTFRLIRPISMGTWGRFQIDEVAGSQTRLSLEIGSTSWAGRLVLRFYPVAVAIQRQIDGEVDHIKTSIEQLTGS